MLFGTRNLLRNMTKRLFAAVLISVCATPAFADRLYVVFDRVTHQCLVLRTQPSPGMRLIGIYKSEAEAKIARGRAKECRP
jgi:hypothetical protein